ncbi:hypothetical protein KR009_011297 [Drosophila setifemur]|nr:hypothetical protein KR009_011297 [Drosophila setifemur]
MDNEIEKFQKADFLETYLQRLRDLGKREREYKKILTSKIKTRKERIVEESFITAISQQAEEKDDLRAQIWVASGKTHRVQSDHYLSQIQCHVECQENLATDINNLKTDIANMDRQTSRMAKLIFNLNMETYSDQRHLAYVMKAKKKLDILENNLEVGCRQECSFAAANGALRQQLIHILNYRTFFNDTYTKMVQKLNSDKKYMLDLMEYAATTFDGCIDVYEKLDINTKREAKDSDLRRVELQGIVRGLTAEADAQAFFECKGKPREMADLQPKEYKRRDQFRRLHKRKIGLYTSVLQKIRDYTESRNIGEVIDKFQQQESLYYSFFNYANEMSYHITMLNNSVNRLFEDVVSLKKDNANTLQEQLDHIASLESKVHAHQESNLTLVMFRDNNDAELEALLQGVEAICKSCNLDASPLLKVLGSHGHVNLVNVGRFLKLLESRVQELTASVYATERREQKANQGFVVMDIEKTCERPTDLDEIVLTQQCPECAEGEAFNLDEGGDLAHVNTVKEARKKLYEKITQPEIQYRLHSISQCRLPRCRLLAAKRNG